MLAFATGSPVADDSATEALVDGAYLLVEWIVMPFSKLILVGGRIPPDLGFRDELSENQVGLPLRKNLERFLGDRYEVEGLLGLDRDRPL